MSNLAIEYKATVAPALMKKFGLTGNQLKLLAVITMTIDHVGMDAAAPVENPSSHRPHCFPHFRLHDCGRLPSYPGSEEVSAAAAGNGHKKSAHTTKTPRKTAKYTNK